MRKTRTTLALCASLLAAAPAAQAAASDEELWWQGATITKTAADGAATTLACPSGTGSSRWAPGCRAFLLQPDGTGLRAYTIASDVSIAGPRRSAKGLLEHRAADAAAFDPAALRDGEHAVVAAEGALLAAGTGTLPRRWGGRVEERTLTTASGVRVRETGAVCEIATATCAPLAVSEARRLAASPADGAEGRRYQWFLEADNRPGAGTARAARRSVKRLRPARGRRA